VGYVGEVAVRTPEGATLSFLRGLSVYRWATWVWMAAVAALHADEMNAGWAWLAVGLLAGALAVTVVSGLLRSSPAIAASTPVIATEVGIGAALITATGWVYGLDHVNGRGPSLGTGWPTAGIIAAGVTRGPWWGGIAGAVIGLSRGLAALASGADELDRVLLVSVLSYTVISILNGVVAGVVMNFVRSREHEVALVRAREEVARTLHDGVLQTLAVVQSRAVDPTLARLARDQEQELRDYLYGDRDVRNGGTRDLEARLRKAGRRFEQTFGGVVDVIVADDIDTVPAETVDAVAGAVAEALTNAGKHGAAERVTIYAEPGDGCALFCSVHDHGAGFDTTQVPEGRGLTDSIRGRVADAGGRVEIRSRVGQGTEVLMWMP
jgi:signal transduction histidine kinase